MLALETGLYALWNADATLTAAVTGGIHRGIAPEKSGHPHLTFLSRTKKVDTLDSPGSVDNGYFECEVTAKVVDLSEDQAAAEAAFARAETLLINNALTVSGYTVMGVQRSGQGFSYPEYQKNRIYQHVGGQFTVWVQKN